MIDEDELEQRANLKAHLEKSFDLPHDAAEFLQKVWSSIQFFDDLADGDSVSRAEVNTVLWDHFIGFSGNTFFCQHHQELKGALATMILKWQASDEAERAGAADAKSYMWRAGFYDVALLTVLLCHGYEATLPACRPMMDFYGETLEEYLEEFKDV